ncbi:MAG: hypothetical protein Q9184_008097, partial [Pyrenodesmia sp. 2 TL-2023]
MGTLFPHFPQQAFAPFFRDFESLFQPEAFGFGPQQARPFAPRFDIKEVPSAYELHGELPGIKQEDIDIQFVDANTLVIKGKTTHESTRTNDSDVEGRVIEDKSTPKAIAADDASEGSSKFHKASVEDEYGDAGPEREGTAATTATTAKEGEGEEEEAPASTSNNNTEVAPFAKEEKPGHKYW